MSLIVWTSVANLFHWHQGEHGTNLNSIALQLGIFVILTDSCVILKSVVNFGSKERTGWNLKAVLCDPLLYFKSCSTVQVSMDNSKFFSHLI